MSGTPFNKRKLRNLQIILFFATFFNISVGFRVLVIKMLKMVNLIVFATCLSFLYGFYVMVLKLLKLSVAAPADQQQKQHP